MEEETGQSRLFVILAIALIGLLVLGLLGIGGVFVIRQNLQEQAAVSNPTPTLTIKLPERVAATATSTAPAAQSQQQPTPINTPVVAPGSGQEAAVGGGDNNSQTSQSSPTPTRTPVVGASGAGLPEQVPETGLGAIEAILIAAGLITVLFVARRMRMTA